MMNARQEDNRPDVYLFVPGEVVILHRVVGSRPEKGDVLGSLREELGEAFRHPFLNRSDGGFSKRSKDSSASHESIRERWNKDENFRVQSLFMESESASYSVVSFMAADEHDAEGVEVPPYPEHPSNQAAIGTVRILRRASRRSETIQDVSLNWLGGCSQPGPIPTGGPGTLPVPIAGSAEELAVHPPPYKPSMRDLPQITNNKAIKVFILDTAPPLQRLKDRYDGTFHDHPILQALLGGAQLPASAPANGQVRPTGSLKKIAYNPQIHQWKNTPLMDFLDTVPILGHEYDMSDHGLFIAGLIDSMLSNQFAGLSHELELIQVLSNHGVGTVETVLWGLLQVLDEVQQNPHKAYAVNCSFVFATPRIPEPIEKGEKAHIRHVPGHKDAFLTGLRNRFVSDIRAGGHAGTVEEAEVQANLDIRDLLRMDGLEGLCKALTQKLAGCATLYTNVAVVAAAGNESKGAVGGRFNACYPAAFDMVTGVAALKDKAGGGIIPASYSNRADEPTSVGFATYGGEDDGHGKANPKDAIAGVFLADFPNSDKNGKILKTTTQNENGWAYWAGTSFAAPLVTAGLVAMLSGNTIQDADDAKRELEGKSASATTDGEKRLRVDFT